MGKEVKLKAKGKATVSKAPTFDATAFDKFKPASCRQTISNQNLDALAMLAEEMFTLSYDYGFSREEMEEHMIKINSKVHLMKMILNNVEGM